MVRASHLLMESAGTGHAKSHAHGAVSPEATAGFERVGMHSIACTVKVDPCTCTIKYLLLFVCFFAAAGCPCMGNPGK